MEEVIDRHPDGGSVLLRIEERETMNSRQTRYLLGVNIWSMNFMKYVILLRGEELIAFNVLGKHRSAYYRCKSNLPRDFKINLIG